MTDLAIAERRQLRRKLSFWRIIAILLVAVAALLAWAALTGPGQAPSSSPHIAVITISGVITDDTDLIERIDRIAGDDDAKALVVRISSPGGTTYGGEVLYKALRRVGEKKPVIADIRTMATSAGYMIALAGDHIIAGDTSITGSIGVIFQYPQLKDLMDKLGVSMEEIKSAPLKAEPSPFHAADEAAKAMIDKLVQDSYGWFVDLVAERRKLPRVTALSLADGSIYTGRQALASKLVDAIGGDKEIKAFLKDRKIDEKLPFVSWDPRRSSSPFFLAGLVEDVVTSLGLDEPDWAKSLKNMADEKLFLDGLLSTWQIDPNKR